MILRWTDEDGEWVAAVGGLFALIWAGSAAGNLALGFPHEACPRRA